MTVRQTDTSVFFMFSVFFIVSLNTFCFKTAIKSMFKKINWVCSHLITRIKITLHPFTLLHPTKSSQNLLGHIYNFKYPFQLASVKCYIQTRKDTHLFYNILGIFAMSKKEIRLTHWLANANCAIYCICQKWLKLLLNIWAILGT